MRGRLLRAICALIAVLVSAQRPLAGEGVVVRGAVVDKAGSPLPGATVTLALEGVSARATTTDQEGQFHFANVPPATGLVRVELPGFQTAEAALIVTTEPPSPLTIHLKLGFEEEVTVTGAAKSDPLSASANADAVELDLEVLRGVPTDGQSLLSLVEAYNPTPGGLSIVIDGNEGEDLTVPAAAIHRLTINRSPYSAEFSRPGKARVEVETEHGSRKYFHGTGALFVRNGALDARNAFAVTNPTLDRRLFEGAFGGPLAWKGTAFFASAQRFINDDRAIVSARLPDGVVSEEVPTSEQRTSVFGRIEYRPNKLRWLSARYDLFDDQERNRGIGGFRLADQGFSTVETRHKALVSDHEVFSDRVANDVQVEGAYVDEQDGSLPHGPAIIVAGAFTGGVPQQFVAERSTSVAVQNVATVTIGNRLVRLGGRVKGRWNDLRDGSNFGGVYEYASLDDYINARPFVFRINEGDPATSFVDTSAFGFAEADLRPLSNLGVTAGVRYSWQSTLDDSNNVAPRLSAAFAPGGGRTIFRGGGGLFYDDLPTAAIGRVRLFDGGIREAVVANPNSNPSTGPPSGAVSSSVWLFNDALEAPSSLQGSVSIERPLWQRSTITVEGLALRGSHLFRARNLSPQDSVRIYRIDSTGTLRTDALTVTFRGRISKFKGTLKYMLSRSSDDTSGVFYLPADDNSLAAEWGRSDFDRRHRFTATGVYEWRDAGLHVGTVISLLSGAPYDITTGSDDNHDLLGNDRPSGVTRNTGQGPGFAQVDLRVTKLFRMLRPPSADPEARKREYINNLEMNVDIFNVFNRTNLVWYVGVLSSPFFGRANAASRPRTLQVSARYRF
jgi:Carboxypeptidase regulatory-like domain